MSTFIAIGGSPKTGITLLKKDGGVSRLEVANMAALNWGAAAPTKKTLAPYARLSSGGGTNTTLAVQDSIDFLTSFSGKADWKKIDPPLPATLRISSAAGDQNGGCLVLDSNSKVYHVDAETRDWKQLVGQFPFKTQQATMVAGESTNGFLLVSNDDLSHLARNNADFSGWTQIKPAAPIRIAQITGDFKNGFVAFGEGQLYMLKADKDPAGWTPLQTPDFDFTALSGNPVEGIAALVNAGKDGEDANLVVYCATLGKDPWVLALVAPKDAVAAA